MKNFLKKYLYLLIVLIVLLLLMLYFIFNKDEVKEERNPLEEEIVNVTEKINVIEENKKIKIDIKGAVKNPGVYELDDNTRVIDQTCSIMIQKLTLLFARNPLISKGI